MFGRASLDGCHLAFLTVLSAACTSPSPAARPETPSIESSSPNLLKPEPSAQSSDAAAPSSPTSVVASPSGTGWAVCVFPTDAHASEGIVKLRVLVNPDGSASTVEILKASDPIFATHAQSCALARNYRPALNAAGEPVTSYTPPFFVRFAR